MKVQQLPERVIAKIRTLGRAGEKKIVAKTQLVTIH